VRVCVFVRVCVYLREFKFKFSHLLIQTNSNNIHSVCVYVCLNAYLYVCVSTCMCGCMCAYVSCMCGCMCVWLRQVSGLYVRLVSPDDFLLTAPLAPSTEFIR